MCRVPGAGCRGLQMDPDLSKAIENAAQYRLLRHYRDEGWQVTDTLHNRHYNAVPVMGSEMLYLDTTGAHSRG